MNDYLSTISKAIAGGLITATISVLARYGFHTSPETVSALGVLETALVGYIIGHIAVYVAPSNA